MLVGKSRYASSSGCAAEEAYLQKIGLINVLESNSFLADSGGKCIKTDGTAVIELDYGFKHSLVGAVESELIYLKLIESELRNLVVDLALALDLRKVAYTLEKPVSNSGSTTRS